MTSTLRRTAFALFCTVSLAAVGCVASTSTDASAQTDQAATSERTSDRSAATAPQNPAPGTAERKAIMAAVHAATDPALHGQPNEIVVSWLQTEGNYAFMMGVVQGKGGKRIDWKKTDYKADVDDGIFDGGHIEALLQKVDGTWRVYEGTDPADKLTGTTIGSTDVWWIGLTHEPGVPAAIFPFSEPE